MVLVTDVDPAGSAIQATFSRPHMPGFGSSIAIQHPAVHPLVVSNRVV
jgi:hypothetical protein